MCESHVLGFKSKFFCHDASAFLWQRLRASLLVEALVTCLPELTGHNLVVRESLRLTTSSFANREREGHMRMPSCGGFHHCFPAVDDEPDPPMSFGIECLSGGFLLSAFQYHQSGGLWPLAEVKDLHLELSASFQVLTEGCHGGWTVGRNECVRVPTK